MLKITILVPNTTRDPVQLLVLTHSNGMFTSCRTYWISAHLAQIYLLFAFLILRIVIKRLYVSSTFTVNKFLEVISTEYSIERCGKLK